MMDFRSKLRTILEMSAHPGMLKRYQRGIIPSTYCALDQQWIHELNIDTVFDIGANVGRFSLTAAAVFRGARIHAFEPLQHCFDAAVAATAHLPNVKIHNYGLGTKNESIEIFANTFSPSSSFLPMTDTHKSAFPFTEGGQAILAQVRTLDGAAQELDIGKNLFVKIDVQGYERDVVAGGAATIAQAKLIMAELSYEELYKGQPLFADVFDQIGKLGFRFAGTTAQMPHPKHGRYLDADCLFVRQG
jgi:FkbM family methyltransferase